MSEPPKNKNLTLKGYLESLRRLNDDHWTAKRALKRLELIETFMPEWLIFDPIEDAGEAVLYWDTLDFGTLLGRGMILKIEQGEYFDNPTHSWNIASLGLGDLTERRGRPEKIPKLNQILIYHLWAAGVKTQHELAEDYGIGIATVQRIIRKWKPKNEKHE